MLGVLLLLALGRAPGQATDHYIRSDRLGLTHISSATTVTPEERYRQALVLGAGWNRWPVYWDQVEVGPGQWNWTGYDRQVGEDLSHGFNINAILIGRPEFYADGNRIQGIHEPIFADGTDTPGEGKALNPANPWTRFVFEAVNRYKPGGVLAQTAVLPLGSGIRVWEIWNEPDFRQFWSASVNDYARLLKISYIVIKQADPNAQVMFGGLLYPTEDNWLTLVLNIFTRDPMRSQFNWYMDIVAVHSYSNPWRSGWLTLVAKQSLKAYGLDRPVWVNETGVPVWDDYPGPVWDSTSLRRSTSEQQAWFFIQSVAYAWSEGADKIFFHQLYDDCGDQPAGTDFVFHDGQLCTGGSLCFGDAHGIYRNLPGSTCFSNHPLPGTARQAARAYRLVAEVFGTEPFTNGEREYLDDSAVTIMFDRPRTEERITVMWNRTREDSILSLDAVGENAQLVSLAGVFLLTPQDDGKYHIALPAAQPDNDPDPPPGAASAIGGPPFILIERVTGQVEPAVVELSVESTPISAEPTQPPPRPTTDPILDRQPPSAQVNELPPISPQTFTVTWSGTDDGGIDRYLIWVRVNGEGWQPWLETTDTSGEYSGLPGRTYEFSAWAVDLAGNWSTNVDLLPQATTQVE